MPIAGDNLKARTEIVRSAGGRGSLEGVVCKNTGDQEDHGNHEKDHGNHEKASLKLPSQNTANSSICGKPQKP